jgi:hypothetical protein
VIVIVAVRVVVIVGVDVIVEWCHRSHGARRISQGPVSIGMRPSPGLLGVSEHRAQRPTKTPGGHHGVVVLGFDPSGTNLDPDGDTIDVNLVELTG